MTPITKDMVINEVIKRHPATIAIFNTYGVDSCCGGGQSIEKTAAADGVELGPLLQALNAAASQSTPPRRKKGDAAGKVR